MYTLSYTNILDSKIIGLTKYSLKRQGPSVVRMETVGEKPGVVTHI